MTKKNWLPPAPQPQFAAIADAIEGAAVAAPPANVSPAPASSTAAASADTGAQESAPENSATQNPQPARGPASLDDFFDFEELPNNCPVTPIGIKGDIYYYLDAQQQLRELKAKDHGRLPLVGLFGDQSTFLYDTWPRIDDKGGVTGWRPEKAAEALMGTAAAKGIIDVTGLVRGAGAWRDEAGQLVMHCGDIVYQSGDEKAQDMKPGYIGRHIYPADDPKPRPAELKDPGTKGARLLLDAFKTWNWRRPEQDPHLLLGWIGASMIGGALKWRPLVWITGDAATGKSTLHDTINNLHGPGGIISASDASAAGLWQKVGHASLPVALDELESEEDNRKNANIIKLARHAASGGSTLRGGADHKGASFTVRNCFMFSSILIPPLLGQDLSRMAILSLDALKSGQTSPALKPQELAKIGAEFRARFMSRWKDLHERLELWSAMLAKAGHGGRGADLFGSLLACYDLLVNDYPPSSDELDEWAQLMNKATLAETEGVQSDAQRCMTKLLSSLCEVYRDGARRTIGSWVEQAAGRFPTHDPGDANKLLSSYGLRVKGEGKDALLLVANDHEGLSLIFGGTRWEKGVWVQSMRRWPDHAVSKSSTNFGGSCSRYTSIPVASLFAGTEKDEDEGGDA